MKFKHKAKVQNGKLLLESKAKYLKTFEHFEGKEIVITIEKYTKPRSDNQNRYYWGVVINTLCNELGYFEDEMHHALREKFLGTREVYLSKDSDPLLVPISTTRLSTVEFEDYLNRIRIWAARDMGTIIPLPNEAEY